MPAQLGGQAYQHNILYISKLSAAVNINIDFEEWLKSIIFAALTDGEDSEDYSYDIWIDCLGAWNCRGFYAGASDYPVSSVGRHTVPQEQQRTLPVADEPPETGYIYIKFPGA